MKKLTVLLLCLAFCTIGIAQRFYTKNGSISFFSKAPIENISASNNQVMSVLDTQSGQLQFSVLIKAFHFKKSLMEEHFNENYLESDKYPKAAFKGSISNLSNTDLSKDGNYPVNIAGDMTIHGVTKNITVPAVISIKSGAITGNAVFLIKLADYNISIPKIVKDNIAETVEVTVSCNYDHKM